MRASASRFCNDHPDNEVNLRCFKDIWCVLYGPVLLHTSGELICPIRLRGMLHQTTWSSWLVLLLKCVPNTPPPFCSLFSLSTQSQLCALKSEKWSPIAVEPTTTPVAGEKNGVVVPPSCAVSVLRAVSEKTTGAHCLDFSSFCALSPFSSCTTTARCGTTIRSQTSPEYPKSRSCARCGSARCLLPSRLTPFAHIRLISYEHPMTLTCEKKRIPKRDFGFSGEVRERRVVPQRAQERYFGYSGDVCERRVVPQRAVVAQEENGDRA
ncbi:Uncharacterized protein Fot_16017 [Forsythia ovata]|uniref:Uncharacterized protein n=1 Tax=Forsythia ovata TaxID=205694 RepID=A0ABD1WAU2_9LAMI